MKNMFLMGIFCMLAAACGGEAQDHAECDHEDDQIEQVVLNHFEAGRLEQPLVDEPWAEMCAGRVGPGQYCFVPVDLQVRQWNYLYTNGGPIWYDGINTERNVVQIRMLSLGWDYQVATTEAQVNQWLYMGTTHPTIPNRVAEAAYYVDQYVPAQEGGTYALHRGCVITLFKTTIENSTGYSWLTEAQKALYVKNIVDHEYTHCFGPPHVTTSGDLMNANAGGMSKAYQGINLNPNAAHTALMDGYLQ